MSVTEHCYMSWPGTPAPAAGEKLRYRAAASPHDAIVLGLPFEAQVYALDWFTDDAPGGRLVLHQLTVPQVVAAQLGLAFEAFTGIDTVVAAAGAAGYVLSAGRSQSCVRGADPQIAAGLGVPGAPNLWTCWQVTTGQRAEAGPKAPTPVFLERAYTQWADTA